jgi:hypothetical protein
VTFTDVVRWSENSWLGVVGRDVFWVFPAAEMVHFVGLCLLMGAMLLIDLRLLGVARRRLPIESVLALIPAALAGLMLNVASGIVFLCAHPENYWSSTAFRFKLAAIAIGGANAVWFKLAEAPRLAGAPAAFGAGARTKSVAAFSLLIWISVIVLGRFLPFVSKSSS